MSAVVSSLPEISISLAPPSESFAEPFSPFGATPLTPPPTDEDAYRPNLLTPPPTMSPRFRRQHSPLCPGSEQDGGRGLEAERFQKLLASSRDTNAALSGKRAPDLRKEIAIKVHKTKQMERRALFLSKISERPSALATLEPKTPPESPAIFHYTQRSPGLQSPLAIYDSGDAADDAVSPWVEQVDFRREPEKKSRPSALPSLDQISARLSSQRHGPKIQQQPRVIRAPLPAFLRSASPPRDQTPESVPTYIPERTFRNQPPTPRPAFPAAPRSKSPAAPTFADKMPPPPQRPRKSPPPPLPVDTTQIHVTTKILPRMAHSASPAQLTERNIALLNSRARMSLDMMSAIRRRTAGSNSVHDLSVAVAASYEERKARRISAPAELQCRARDQFSHPVLALPGAF